LFYSAEIQIPYDGRWQLKVSIRRGTDHATLQGVLDVDRPLPPVTAYWQWFSLLSVSPSISRNWGFYFAAHTFRNRAKTGERKDRFLNKESTARRSRKPHVAIVSACRRGKASFAREESLAKMREVQRQHYRDHSAASRNPSDW